LDKNPDLRLSSCPQCVSSDSKKLFYLLNPAANWILHAARTGQVRGGRLAALEGGCGLGRNGCGGDTGDDDGKSKNTDGEFHGLVAPLWILIDRKGGFLYSK
jgi:hypothetical protein